MGTALRSWLPIANDFCVCFSARSLCMFACVTGFFFLILFLLFVCFQLYCHTLVDGVYMPYSFCCHSSIHDMNVRIVCVHVMECMHAYTRP